MHPIYQDLYRRLAFFEGLYDGDTVYLTVDNGEYRQEKHRPFRVYGIDCPELYPPKSYGTPEERAAEKVAGQEARARAIELLEAAVSPLVCQTLKMPGKPVRDKYGRGLAKIEIPLNDSRSINLADQLILEGHGVPYYGGKRQRPWKPLRPLGNSDEPISKILEALA